MVLKYSVYKGNQGELLQESFPSAACQYVLDVLPHAGSGSRQQKSLLAVHRQDLSLTWLQHNTLLCRFLGPRACPQQAWAQAPH